ncbi:pollen-specific leucine-rich repeat extensin-like protein 4 [Iris pallida]|uniref:Pollen-specific leucine-rich repeat extensin-like protein 4 n=1 Tax=Iris pallida TaxID=29817 RepID=A0AAX6FX29_IRIPA|nr:pollen-specific leucine-rich repeat extensin-like protein 4 [Iris pallida]
MPRLNVADVHRIRLARRGCLGAHCGRLGEVLLRAAELRLGSNGDGKTGRSVNSGFADRGSDDERRLRRKL